MNGTRGLITPHLDALANAGVILKNYCESPQNRVHRLKIAGGP